MKAKPTIADVLRASKVQALRLSEAYAEYQRLRRELAKLEGTGK